MKKCTLIIYLFLAVVLTSCASTTTSPQAGNQSNFSGNIQDVLRGSFEGELYESGAWHVWSREDGNTASSGKIVFDGQKLEFITANLINPFWAANKKTRVNGGRYKVEYVIIGNNEISFTSPHSHQELHFKITGPDTIEGYRTDFPDLVWKLHRVAKKNIAVAADPKNIYEEPKREPTSVSLPVSR